MTFRLILDSWLIFSFLDISYISARNLFTKHYLKMALSPALRSPLTDLTGCRYNYQSGTTRAKFEMKMIECLEAYGMDKGSKICRDQIEDFQECAGLNKQKKRFEAMRLERHRQYFLADRKEHYAPPPREDAY